MIPPPSSCLRASVDAHFAARLSPAGERALRAHLPACADCRAYYERHLLFTELDPTSRSAASRLAVGLGIEPAPRSPRPGHFAWAAGVIAVAVLLGLPLRRPAGDEFTARGAGTGSDPSTASAAEAPALNVYRVKPASALIRSGSSLQATEDLAFAYANPTGYRHLLVFGVDEHRHVYWYYPAWTDEAEDPGAIDVASGAELRELPEAIRHPLDGRELTVFAVFLDDPLSVRRVEALVAQGGPDAPLPLPSAYQQRLRFAVQR